MPQKSDFDQDLNIFENLSIYGQLYGMSSDDAQITHYGEKKSHRASEGKTVYVDYRGPVKNTIEEIIIIKKNFILIILVK